MIKINTIIIGLGDIGSGFSELYKNERNHTVATIKNKNFKLLYGIDLEKKKRSFFKKKFGVKTFDKVDKIPKKDEINFAIISSNTKSHQKIIRELIKFKNLKYILCEKPFCKNLNEAKKIQKILKIRKIELFINYFRRCLPYIKYIKKFIKNDNKKFVKVSYPKTLLNNGSHFIDLIFFLFKFKSFRLVKKNNYFRIIHKNIDCSFYENKDKKYQSKLIFENKDRKLILKKNLIEYITRDEKLIKKIKFKNLYNQRFVLSHLINKIVNKKSSIATIDDGINVHKVINKLL